MVDLSFKEYANKDAMVSRNVLEENKPASIFERIADPAADFLTGSQILEDDEALAAAQKAGSEKAAFHGCRIKWAGLAGTVYKDDNMVETTRIHGMAWNKVTKEARGLRMDLLIAGKRNDWAEKP